MTKKKQRNFILGSKWLYYKIYTSPKTADNVLTQIIGPLTEGLLEKKIIDSWFFIRFADPHHHIRVRFHCTNIENVGVVISYLFPHFQNFADQDLIWKIQTDTYKREIERYGEKTIEVSEEFFYYDSKMILDFLKMSGMKNEELRWLFSLKAIDSLLESFGYSDQQKKSLLINISSSFLKEFGDSKMLRKQLSEKFRSERNKIENIMKLSIDNNKEYGFIAILLNKKNQNIEHLSSEIIAQHKMKALEIELDHLIGSYIHMLMNRLFISKNRVYELLCYDFLRRYYISKIAKKKLK